MTSRRSTSVTVGNGPAVRSGSNRQAPRSAKSAVAKAVVDGVPAVTSSVLAAVVAGAASAVVAGPVVAGLVVAGSVVVASVVDGSVVEGSVAVESVAEGSAPSESLPLHAAHTTAPPSRVPPKDSMRRREMVLPVTGVWSMAPSLHDEGESGL